MSLMQYWWKLLKVRQPDLQLTEHYGLIHVGAAQRAVC